MKTLHKLLACCFLLFACTNLAMAQTPDAPTLIKQGIQLHDQGKFAEAIDKYQQALKADPNNMQAEFEMSFSMFSSGKGNEAIPHLEKIIKSPPDADLVAQACDILGSIYDDSQQPDKAIASYEQGIKLNPKYQRLRYNLALALIRQKKFAEAEASAIEAIKLDPRHASSQQVYAIALQSQNKNAAALIVYCSFLMLEPQTSRSVTDNQQIQNIIQSKYKVTGDKAVSVFVTDIKDKDMGALETALSLSAASVTLDANKTKSKMDQFQDQLKTIFGIAGELSAKKTNKDFFWKYYADYFYQLSKSDQMSVFTRLITVSVNQQENLAWFKEHTNELKAFEAWVRAIPRSF